jgi:hypothetical protein
MTSHLISVSLFLSLYFKEASVLPFFVVVML